MIISMSELPASAPDNMASEQPLTPSGFNEESLHTSLPSPEAQISAYAGWLERRGIDPAGIPHLTMRPQEFTDFRNVLPDQMNYTRRAYGIPEDDQDNCQYALINIEPDDPNQAHAPILTVVNDADFGTMIDDETIDADFQQLDRGPQAPDLTGGALKTVEISDALHSTGQGLQAFAQRLMKGNATDPFSSQYGDIGVRAGGVAPGQKDAFVWTVSPITKSVELTLAFPSQYDSVCVVRGQRREAINGKPAMAQIDNPVEVLKIEGENLRELQSLYKNLYSEPDFALTEVQRQKRDELFNDTVMSLISDEASENRSTQEAQARRMREQASRTRQMPLS
jgi:hypothetical protein